jgi:hypothetical protein
MRGMLTLLTAGLLGLCVTACGGAVKSSAPEVPFPSSTVPVHGYIKSDQDGDNDASEHDDARVRGYGHPASATNSERSPGSWNATTRLPPPVTAPRPAH